jgi:hypothetical protein
MSTRCVELRPGQHDPLTVAFTVARQSGLSTARAGLLVAKRRADGRTLRWYAIAAIDRRWLPRSDRLLRSPRASLRHNQFAVHVNRSQRRVRSSLASSGIGVGMMWPDRIRQTDRLDSDSMTVEGQTTGRDEPNSSVPSSGRSNRVRCDAIDAATSRDKSTQIRPDRRMSAERTPTPRVVEFGRLVRVRADDPRPHCAGKRARATRMDIDTLMHMETRMVEHTPRHLSSPRATDDAAAADAKAAKKGQNMRFRRRFETWHFRR